MYWLLLSIILIPFSFITKKIDRAYLYALLSIIIASFLILRFGVGVDYFSYYEIYGVYKKLFSFYTEPLFGLLNLVFNKFDLPFSFFMGFISFLMIFITLNTIGRYSENKMFSLLLFFTLYYSVYYESAIRAGFVISLFIYAYFNFLRNGKLLKYYLFVVIAIGFHYSSIFLLFVPFLKHIQPRFFVTYKYFLGLFLFCFVLYLVFSFKSFFSLLITSLIPKYTYYLEKKFFSRSYFTVVLYFIRGFFVITLYKKRKK